MKPTKLDKDLVKRTEAYAEQIRRLYAMAVNDILEISSHMDVKEGEMFSFSENKRLSKLINDKIRALHSSVYLSIKKNIELEWNYGHDNLDNMIVSKFGKKILKNESFAGWFHRNTEAMDAFIVRSDKGLDLSKRVWKYSNQLRDEMEIAMTVSIGEGVSASQVSRRVRQYLNEPDKLFRRVRNEDGNLKLSKAAKAYKPGQGVYRSSAKNAMRLARTETNMAYRKADNDRWQKLDFVLGQEVKLAHDHPEYDICDELAGKYPKDFVFEGWHPQCFCYHVAILLPPEEMLKMQKAIANGEEYDIESKRIKNVPDNFKNWVHANKDKLEIARGRGKTPYFVKNNNQIVKDIIDPPTALEVAKRRHKARTPDQIESIQRKWHTRNVNRKYGNNVLSVMSGIKDVDISGLEKALGGGDIALILSEAKKLKAIGKEIYGLKHIENPMQVAKDFSMKEAKLVDKAVKDKLASWSHLSLEDKKKKLVFEVDWLAENPKYDTWEVAQQAYSNELEKVSELIEWEAIKAEYNFAKSYYTDSADYEYLLDMLSEAIDDMDNKVYAQELIDKLNAVKGEEEYWKEVTTKWQKYDSFKTKSKPYLDLVKKLDEAIHKKEKHGVNLYILEIEQKLEDLAKAREYRQRRRSKKTVASGVMFDEMTEKVREELYNEFLSVPEFEYPKVDEEYREHSKKAWGMLSEEEKRTVTKYTETFSYLNEPLRGLNYYGDRAKEEYDKDMPILTDALNKFQLDRDIVVRRGTKDFRIKELGYNLSHVKPGDEYTDGGFLSSSIQKDKGFRNYPINLIIVIPKGARGIYAEPFSHYTDHGKFSFSGTLWDGSSKEVLKNEAEWVGQRGARYRVIRKFGNDIYLQMIGQLQ